MGRVDRGSSERQGRAQRDALWAWSLALFVWWGCSDDPARDEARPGAGNGGMQSGGAGSGGSTTSGGSSAGTGQAGSSGGAAGGPSPSAGSGGDPANGGSGGGGGSGAGGSGTSAGSGGNGAGSGGDAGEAVFPTDLEGTCTTDADCELCTAPLGIDGDCCPGCPVVSSKEICAQLAAAFEACGPRPLLCPIPSCVAPGSPDCSPEGKCVMGAGLEQ